MFDSVFKFLQPYLATWLPKFMGAKTPTEVAAEATKAGNDAVAKKPAGGISDITGTPEVVK